MTHFLHECLKAVGLQHHYARLSSAGIHHAAHLSMLTMEDYPILGVCSMEDRTRLFNLIKMIQSLDLETLEQEDGDDFHYNADRCYVGNMDRGFTNGVCKDSHNKDEKYSAVSKFQTVSKSPCVRRRLDFSSENRSHGQQHFSHPFSSVGDEPGQSKGSAIPVQIHCDTASAVVCSCKGKYNHRLGVLGDPSDCDTGGKIKPHINEGISMYNSYIRLSPKSKPRTSSVASKRLNYKPVGCKDKKYIPRNIKLETSIDRTSEHIHKPTPVYESKRRPGYNYGLPLSSPSALNKKLPEGQRISVCVRKRPQTGTECRRGEADVVTTPSKDCVIVHESKEAVDLAHYILQHRFYFDQVFGEKSSNKDVYQKTAYPLVQHMLNGGKATCFAYGQTGAGKTHTMLGSSSSRPGLYALAAQDIFSHLSTTQTDSPFLVYVSFFEIYCGQLYDLLGHRKRLFAREDGQKVVHIAGLRDIRVDSVSSLLEVIAEGTEERTQGTSGVNPLSSRSHALLQIQLRRPNQQVAGRMWFVDLAGSERASDTKEPDKQSRIEGAEINQSLLALKECIRSLDQEQSHTPFRQSKLTQVLKDSFVGDSMTCMIANISPGHLATENTLNTLRYADRVKELRGQGERRGRRRGKTASSPKRNLSNSTTSSNSSTRRSGLGIRGRSPPKKPKLAKQKEIYSTPTPTGYPILCSTPKNIRGRGEVGTSTKRGIRLEQITSFRGLLGIGENKERLEKAVGTAGRRQEQNRDCGNANLQEHNKQSTLKEGERRAMKDARQFESIRDSSSEMENLRVTDLQEANERNQEREMHLKEYHQQLQQFMPLSASLSSSTWPSFNSSNPLSFLSSVSLSPCSSLRHSSGPEVSAPIHEGLDQVIDAYSTRVQVQSDGNIQQFPFVSSGGLQTETSPRDTTHNDDISFGYSVEGGVRVRIEDLRPAGFKEEEGKERRWAWMATAETEQTGSMTGARPAAVEEEMYYNCDLEEMAEVGVEGLDTSDFPAYAVWSIEEDESSDSGKHFHHPAIESTYHHAPAERPLSPGCKHSLSHMTSDKPSKLPMLLNHTQCTSKHLHQPLLNAQMNMPSGSHREDARANDNKRVFSNAHLVSTNRQMGTKKCADHLNSSLTNPDDPQTNGSEEGKVKRVVLHQDNYSTESYSQIIDPFSISLLQVDTQAATASFLKGELSNSSPCCFLDNRSREDNGRIVEKEQHVYKEMASTVEDEDREFLSLSARLQSKRHFQPTSKAKTSYTTERRKDSSFTTREPEQGGVNPHVPGVMITSVQDQENSPKPQTRQAIDVFGGRTPASPIKPLTSAPSLQTSVLHVISSSVQSCIKIGSNRSYNTMKNGATNMMPHNDHSKSNSSVSKTARDCVLVNSLQPNNLTQSKIEGISSKEESRTPTSLHKLDELDQTQWRVVQAHWEQLEEMEALWHAEGTLLCQYSEMPFGDYVHKLEEILNRKSQCVQNMIAQLKPYLKPSHSEANKYNQ